MPIDEKTRGALASVLHQAAKTATPTPQLTLAHPDLSPEDGYDIQRTLIGLRIAEGARLVGRKMGLTSRAKMVQVGVHSPIYGHLTSDMQLANGDELDHAACCHPRVEPEIAFLMGKRLEGVCSTAQALDAVSAVCCALEVIDSRYENFKFTLPDVVADNASSCRFVLGERLLPPTAFGADLDLGNLGMVMEHNGQPSQIGSSAAIFEHPARSLATLSALLAERGEALLPGDVVLAGGATAAVAVAPGDRIRLRTDGLGVCEVFVR